MIAEVNVKDFLNTGFRSFSAYDCKINIPSMIDGFKISQRKVMYNMLAKNKKLKVEQFANSTSEYTHYHHGSGNLEGVIVGLAQNFTGSNNVNFLTPIGQFGNILNGSAAAGRYISVEPNANFRKWFKKDDDCILEYEYEDGEQIEPVYYIPIAPTILFNGSAGIGTGYATNILCYNPVDVMENVKNALGKKPLKVMTPWYSGYKGKVRKVDGQTIFTGTFERVNSTTIRITALPIGYDLESYKGELGKLLDKDLIKDYDDHSTDAKWDITVYSSRAWIGRSDEELLDSLKLITKHSENITVWNEDKKIRKFSSPEELIEYFVNWRVSIYEKRRLMQIKNLQEELDWHKEKIYFIKFYIENSKWFSQSNKTEIEAKMISEKFKNIDRLLSIKVYNLTKDAIQDLKNDIIKLNEQIKEMEGMTSVDMYRKDLKF